MKYRRLALAAAFLLAAIPFAGHAAAEQAAAETYRALFAGNHFLLEYQVAGEAQFRQIVSDGTRRFSNLGVQRKKNVSYSYDVYLKDQALYQFFQTGKGKLTARVLPVANVESSAIDPTEKWPEARKKLALPQELSIFAWQDAWTHHAPSERQPVFAASSVKTVAGKSYDCDRYLEDIMTQAQTVAGQLAYDALYENGKLVAIEEYLLRNGQETHLETLDIQSLTGDLGTHMDEPAGEVPVYAANDGGIEELMKQPRYLGPMGGTKDEKK